MLCLLIPYLCYVVSWNALISLHLFEYPAVFIFHCFVDLSRITVNSSLYEHMNYFLFPEKRQKVTLSLVSCVWCCIYHQRLTNWPVCTSILLYYRHWKKNILRHLICIYLYRAAYSHLYIQRLKPFFLLYTLYCYTGNNATVVLYCIWYKETWLSPPRWNR